MTGEEDAMRVISRKPPAAMVFMYSASLSRALTKVDQRGGNDMGKVADAGCDELVLLSR